MDSEETLHLVGAVIALVVVITTNPVPILSMLQADAATTAHRVSASSIDTRASDAPAA